MKTKTTTKPKSKKYLLAPGHRACAGCGQMIAAIAAMKALGPNTIMSIYVPSISLQIKM